MTRAVVTVIIPTVADERRGETIWRAVASAGPSSGVEGRTVVIVNGDRFSPSLVERLRSTPAVEVEQIAPGSLPLALAHGRSKVDTEFFAFLDDDDEFLPGGLRIRVDAIRADPHLAFVVTNGLLARGDNVVSQVQCSAARIEAEPLAALVDENWLATSASGLYRSNMVSQEEISSVPAYLEWTYLGFLLAGKKKFRFLDVPTYRRYDLPGSVSKSAAYRQGSVAALHRILALDLPQQVRAGLRRKLGSVHHSLSSEYLVERKMGPARWHHWNSLRYPGRLRYLMYSRKLLKG